MSADQTTRARCAAALGMAITFIVSSAGTFDPTGPLGAEVFFDSLTMFVFFLLTGRWLEMRLRDRTAGALEALTNRLPDTVLRLLPDGRQERVAIRRLAVGDTVLLFPGEAFPADGTVMEGETLADEALLSGESRPVPRGVGAQVLAGSNNLQASVKVRIDRTGADTRFAQIVELMETAAQHKPRMAQLADRAAKPFLLFVLAAAAAAGIWWWPTDPGHALMIAAAVLIVTCPCALSLATPAALLAAAGTMARSGILVRNLGAMESLADVDTVVFDKTGTLTRDGLTITSVRTRAGMGAPEAAALAAALASQSLHPASRAVAAYTKSDHSLPELVDVREHIGLGVSGQLLQPSTGITSPLRLGSATFCGLGACRTWSAESENRPQRVQFLPDLQPNSRAIGQKDGEKWAAAVDLQPAISKSDWLPGHGEVDRVGAQQRWELWATQAAAAQSQFNSAITQHNLAVNQFPAVVLARLFGFRPAGSL